MFENMKFTETHEWIAVEGNVAIVGVTHHAQKELGDIVFVELPQVGKVLKMGDIGAVLESTKAAADVYTPVSGTVLESNARLKEQPELINLSPEQDGWLFKLELLDKMELEGLLERSSYELLIK